MPHADLHAGPLRAFVQGIAGYAIGVAGGAGPVDKTGIDLLQGFADFRLPLRDDVTVTLRGGRELVALGSERLVGTRYGPNVPQPFDGVRGLVKIRGVNINVFHLRPVRIGPHNFDDKTDSSRRLSGVYATLPLKIGTAAGLDVYFLDYHRNIATFDQGAAKENRRTWGTRFFGRAGNWSWNWEGMVQGGTFGPARIRAWSIATETSHIFPDVPLKPKVRLRADIASGDKNPADPDLGTFNPLFPKGKYFGELSPIGPYNIINVNPNVDLDLGKGFVLGIASVAYWRQSRRDGVYDIPGHLIRSGAGSQARFIGVQGEAVLSWQADPALSMAASFSLFKPGRFIEETGPSRMIRMIGLETMYRF